MMSKFVSSSFDLVVETISEHICYPPEDNDLTVTKRKDRRTLFDEKKNKSITMGLSDVYLKPEMDVHNQLFVRSFILLLYLLPLSSLQLVVNILGKKMILLFVGY